MTRFTIKYFVIHLIVSLCIGVLSALLVYFVWYPNLIAKAMGVSRIFLMMLFIDIIVGPILTLFVSKPGKKGLWFDLLFIICIQLSALSYGIWHIFEGRPVWQVVNIYRVELVQAGQVDYQDSKLEFSKDSLIGPRWAMVRPAKDKKEQSDWLMDELEGKPSPSHRAILFEPLEKNWNYITKESQPLSNLQKWNDKLKVNKELAKFPQADAYLPMMGGDIDMTVLLDNKNQKILGIVDLRPWD